MSLEMKIASLQNILTNKVADVTMRHYSGPEAPSEAADLRSVYEEAFCMEFTTGLQGLTGLPETLVALAVSTSVFVHVFREQGGGESVESIVTRAKQCVTCQLQQFDVLFPRIIQLFDDSDSD